MEGACLAVIAWPCCTLPAILYKIRLESGREARMALLENIVMRCFIPPRL